MSDHLLAVNRLTRHWLEHVDAGGVLSGAGVWPLLAVLASSADEPGRTELSAAVGVPADGAMAAAADVIATLDAADGIDAALGLWAQRAASVSARWQTELPAGTFGELTGDPSADQPVLDEWARRRTGGLIDRFPVPAGPMLILAAAVALRTRWVHAFTDEPMKAGAGPWRGRNLAGLARTTSDVDDLRVAETAVGPITVTTIAGDNGLDVCLVLGATGLGPADVLPLAVDVLAGEVPSTSGSVLLDRQDEPAAPGVAIVAAARPSLATRAVRFTVRSEHDLVKNAAIFGLTEVCSDGGHFSRIGPVPLQVDQARQSAVAIFSAAGFEAAAVTAIGLRLASLPIRHARGLAVTYDRPFGFLAVHRATGLIVFGGWVTDPEPWNPSQRR